MGKINIEIDTNKDFDYNKLRNFNGCLPSMETIENIECKKVDEINNNFPWKPEYFKKAKITKKIFFEDDIKGLEDEEEKMITSYGWSALSKYIRKGKWCYNLRIDYGKISSIEKKKLYLNEQLCRKGIALTNAKVGEECIVRLI